MCLSKKFVVAILSLLCLNVAQAAGFDAEKDPFVIGMFGVLHWDEETFAWMEKMGVNYVHSYRLWREENMAPSLDLAAKHNMKVMVDLGAHIRIGKNAEPDWEEKIAAQVKTVKDHPAIGVWQIWDEPGTNMLPQVRKLNNLVKSIASQPTELVMNERAEYWNSRGYSDIWAFDNYPVRGMAFPDENLQWHTRAMRNASAEYNYKGTPFFAVTQATDFSCFTKNIKDPERLANLRYPNLTEMRLMLFSDLCYGVRGIWFFSEAHCHRERPQGRAFVAETLEPVIQDIRSFLTLVPQPWKPTLRDTRKIDVANKVSFASFDTPSGTVIILANDSKENLPLAVDLNAFEKRPSDGNLVPWGFTRKESNASLQKGFLNVPAALPWEVFVWTMK